MNNKTITVVGKQLHVSDEGVISLPCGRVIRQFLDRKGYQKVRVYVGKKRHKFWVHTLVALAFIGPRPQGLEIDHIDRNKLNNKASNLRYVTISENRKNRTRTDASRMRGERNGSSKLTSDKVKTIFASNEPNQYLAKMFGVSKGTIYLIKHGRVWKHLLQDPA